MQRGTKVLVGLAVAAAVVLGVIRGATNRYGEFDVSSDQCTSGPATLVQRLHVDAGDDFAPASWDLETTVPSEWWEAKAIQQPDAAPARRRRAQQCLVGDVFAPTSVSGADGKTTVTEHVENSSGACAGFLRTRVEEGLLRFEMGAPVKQRSGEVPITCARPGAFTDQGTHLTLLVDVADRSRPMADPPPAGDETTEDKGTRRRTLTWTVGAPDTDQLTIAVPVGASTIASNWLSAQRPFETWGFSDDQGGRVALSVRLSTIAEWLGPIVVATAGALALRRMRRSSAPDEPRQPTRVGRPIFLVFAALAGVLVQVGFETSQQPRFETYVLTIVLGLGTLLSLPFRQKSAQIVASRRTVVAIAALASIGVVLGTWGASNVKSENFVSIAVAGLVILGLAVMVTVSVFINQPLRQPGDESAGDESAGEGGSGTSDGRAPDPRRAGRAAITTLVLVASCYSLAWTLANAVQLEPDGILWDPIAAVRVLERATSDIPYLPAAFTTVIIAAVLVAAVERYDVPISPDRVWLLALPWAILAGPAYSTIVLVGVPVGILVLPWVVSSVLRSVANHRARQPQPVVPPVAAPVPQPVPGLVGIGIGIGGIGDDVREPAPDGAGDDAPADDSKHARRHELGQTFDEGPAGDAAGNTAFAVTVGAIAAIVPVGYFIWGALETLPARTQYGVSAVFLVSNVFVVAGGWLVTAWVFAKLHRLLPGRTSLMKALTLVAAWFAVGATIEILNRWNDHGTGRVWTFQGLQLAAFLIVVALAWDLRSLLRAGSAGLEGAWKDLQTAYAISRPRQLLAAASPVILTFIALGQQAVSGTGLDFVQALLENAPKVLGK